MKKESGRFAAVWNGGFGLSIFHIGIADGMYGLPACAASDGLQRTGGTEAETQISEEPGTVMTDEELRRWIDDETSRNREQRRAQEERAADSCAAWNPVKYRLTKEYDMSVKETDQGGYSDAASGDGRAVSENGRTEPSVSDDLPVSQEQIALLCGDGRSFDTGKTAEEYWEQSFDEMAPHAPKTVKKAWIDAAGAAGVDGMGVSGNGKLSHITQMMVRRCTRQLRGEAVSGLLGTSVQSAAGAAKQALYDLEHPQEPGRAVSPQKRLNMAKEKNFYLEFLKRLQGL